MKKINLLLLLFLCTALTTTVYGQKLKPTTAKNQAVPVPQAAAFDGTEPHDGVLAPSADGNLYQQYQGTEEIGKEVWMGFSSYDLQTNGVNKHRVHTNNGITAAAWTFHEGNVDENTAFPTRGSGYNWLTNGSPVNGTGGFPATRLEDRRVGWGNMIVLDSGRELVISHGPNAGATSNDIVITTKDPGSDWTATTTLPTVTAANPGLLWPHVGTDGETIHLICITTPDGNEGGLYQGMDGALLYFRSSDGGDTWDKQDVLLPGINSTNFPDPGTGAGQSSFAGDGYSIAVTGDNVVVVNYADGFGDVDVWMSSDKGENWSGPRKAFDSPIGLEVIGVGYDLNDIGGGDPDGPGGDGMGGIDTSAVLAQQLAVENCDGTGNAFIDANGVAHVVFGRTYYTYDDTTAAGPSFYPFTGQGLRYWNSNMDDHASFIIQSTSDGIDVNGNDTLDYFEGDFAYLSTYGGTGLTSQPSIIVSDDGIITVAYQQKMENLLRPGIEGDLFYPDPQHYTQIFMTAVHMSQVMGDWQPAYNVINPDVMIVPALIPSTEAAHAHLSITDGSNDGHLFFQWDEEPGMFVYNANDEANDKITGNTQSIWGFNALDVFPNVLNSVSTEEVANIDAFKLQMTPNPADYAVEIQYELPSSARSTITVSTIVGQRVTTLDNGVQAAGQHVVGLDVSKLTAGVYIVTFRSDNKVATQKLVVE